MGFLRSQEIQYLGLSVSWQKLKLVRALVAVCHAIKLENTLPLFINVRKWVGSVLTSGLTFNFTQVKVKDRHASQSELYILKKIVLTQKLHCEVSIIIAMN